jgi:endonuclease/exonuclease/phosphatase (EEP) superfamily protein YafD
MDRDPACCLDYIFYKGLGVKAVRSDMMGGKCDQTDPTIYGSDHFPIVTEFEISNLLKCPMI